MKNLKRALSFALATVMLVGMMVVGVSAASFGDADEIVNTDAVNTMVALGIIKGKDDGNFDPEGIVTRAEMAKMICVALNGGKDPNLAGGGLYADTKGHWASGYIDYCTNMGIVSGDTAGNFNPDKTVTGTEAAKMILIALGYNAETEKFVNDANWALNINIVANTKDLYKDLAILPAEGLTRDNAAQMLWNGMDAVMIEYDYKLTTVNGELQTVAIAKDKQNNPTILKEKFGLNTTKGVLVATGEYDLSATLGTNARKASEDGFVVAADVVNGTKQTAADTYFEYKEMDLTDMMGQYVRVLSDKNAKVYGVYAEDQNKVVTSTLSKVEIVSNSSATADGKIKVDGTEYKFSNTNKVYNGENAGTYANFNAIPSKKAMADAVTFIDNTGDGKFDVALITPILAVSKVTYVSSTTFTANGSFKFADVEAPEDLAKDEYVVRTSNYYLDANKFVRAEALTGEVKGTKGSSPVTDVLVGGTWYKSATDAAGTSTLSGDALALDSEYDLVVVNGIIYRADLVSAASKDLLVVKAVAGAVNAAGNTEATVLFTDGTSETVVLKGSHTSSAVDKLYTYKVKNNVYEITEVTTGTDVAGYDNAVKEYSGGFVKSSKTINNKAIASDAVILVKYDKDSTTGTDYAWKVMTGAELNKLGNSFTSQVKTTYLYNNSGFADIKVAFMQVDGTQASHAMMSGITANTEAGYVVSGSYTESNADTTYTTFKVWNGTEVVTLKDEAQNTWSVGAVLTYEVDADGFIIVTDSDTAPVAITALDETQKRIAIDGDAKDLDDDYVVLYVDTAKDEGIESGELVKATSVGTGRYIKNAKVIYNSGDVKYIFIDAVKNEWDGAGEYISGNVTLTAGETLSLNGVVATNTTVTVKSGATVKLNGVTLVGEGGFTSTADIKLTANTNGGVTLETTNADVKLAANLTMGASDVIDLGTGKLTGEDGVKLTIVNTSNFTAGQNFYTTKAPNPSAGAESTETYVWTNVDTDPGETLMGWLRQ